MVELLKSPFTTPCTMTTIHCRDMNWSTLSNSGPASSKVAADISSSQSIVFPRHDSICRKFDIQFDPRFHRSRSLSLIRVRSGQAAALPILPRIPKFKRLSRKKIEKGNNQLGRAGKLRCTACRIRHTKCVFISDALPCNFCLENNGSEPCIKLWSPKIHATSAKMESISFHPAYADETIPSRLALWNRILTKPTPSRPLSNHNPSIESQDLRLLDWVYCNEFSPIEHGPTRIFTLIQKFASLYGASITHSSLHHAVCAYIAFSCSGPAESDSYSTEEFIRRTCVVLKQRLNDTPVLDEGDLLATYLLAMCEPDEPDRFCVLFEGFISFVKFFFAKSQGDLSFYTLSAFWETGRDELVYSIWQSAIQPSRKNRIVARFDEVIRKVSGNTAFRRDSKPITGGKDYFCSATFLATSWRQFLTLANRFRGQIGKTTFEKDEEFISMIPDIRRNLYEMDEDEVFGYLSTKLVEVVEYKASDAVRPSIHPMHQALHIGASLLWRELSRLLLVVLETSSIPNGKCSPSFFAAVETLFSMLGRIEVAFAELEMSFCKCGKVEATEVEGRLRCPLHNPCYYKRDVDGYFEWVAVETDQYCWPTWTWLDFRKKDFLNVFSEIWEANEDILGLLFSCGMIVPESYGCNGWLTKEFSQRISWI